ncbi:MAG: flagellar filament capping protein FliD [Bacteriovoracia bacterium]
MGLRFDPIGGGQFKQLVNQMIEAEKQPVKALEARKAKEQNRIKLFGEFKSKFADLKKSLDEISSFKKLTELKVDLGDGENLMSVTVDKDKAKPGNYTIEINELAGRASMISNGFADPDEKVLGMGFVVAYGPEGKFDIFVDEEHSSLRGVADLINAQKDSPVQASVIRDAYEENGWKLIVKAKKDGYDNQVDFPEFYFLGGDDDFYINETRDSRNAQLKVDDYEIEAGSNDVPDFLQGVNIHLKEAKPGRPFTMTISVDNQKVSGKVKGMVDNINNVLGFINAQNKVDEKSDTSQNFTGDTGLQGVEYRFRNLMHEGFGVGVPGEDNFRIMHLNEMGIEMTREGTVKFNEDKFTKALEVDFNGVAEAVSGEMGFVNQFAEVLNVYGRPNDGLLALREKGLRTRIDQIDTQIANKERLIERKTQNLVDRFSRLQATLGAMQQQQAYMQATLGAAGGGGGMVQQLLGG